MSGNYGFVIALFDGPTLFWPCYGEMKNMVMTAESSLNSTTVSFLFSTQTSYQGVSQLLSWNHKLLCHGNQKKAEKVEWLVFFDLLLNITLEKNGAHMYPHLTVFCSSFLSNQYSHLLQVRNSCSERKRKRFCLTETPKWQNNAGSIAAACLNPLS